MFALRLAVMPYLFSLNKSRDYAESRNHRNTKRIVIIIIQRPEYDTGDLENIKGMNDLRRINTQSPTGKNQRISDTCLVYHQRYSGFAFDVNQIWPEDCVPLVAN